MRRLVAALVLFVVLATPALGVRSSELALVSEDISQPGAGDTRPTWCWNEDDSHLRRWVGSLAPGQELIATERFCDRPTDGASAGGTGLFLFVEARGDLTAFVTQPKPQYEANWPPPPYPYPDVPALFTGTHKGKTQSAACVVPLYHVDTDTGLGAIAGGTYTLTVRNDGERSIRDVTVIINVRMAHAVFQESCPLEYRNLD